MGTATRCQHCGNILHGRTDKRFCNDDCRNSYNRAQKQAYKRGANPNIPAILKIIQKNYELLRANGQPETDSHTVISTGSPETYGIHTKFYTSIYQEGDSTWYCCFDYGWKIYEAGAGWGIRYLPEKALLI